MPTMAKGASTTEPTDPTPEPAPPPAPEPTTPDEPEQNDAARAETQRRKASV